MIPRDTQDDRKRQIDTLKIFNDNVIEVSKNEEYSVGFTSAGRQFNLNVYLVKNFPKETPRLVINPSINHQWVQGYSGEIQNAPGLLNFTIHSDLGRVVQAIIREFERSPPALWSDQSNATTKQPQQHVPHILKPIIHGLENLSISDLKQFDTDNQYLDDFVEGYESVQLLNDELDNLINEVETIAEENISKQEELNNLKQSVSESFDTFKSLGEKYESVNKRYQQKTDEFAPLHIKELLQIAVSTSDADCEFFVEKFLSGNIDVQTFLDRYMAAKKLTTLRKAKEERLSHQLNALEKATF